MSEFAYSRYLLSAYWMGGSGNVSGPNWLIGYNYYKSTQGVITNKTPIFGVPQIGQGGAIGVSLPAIPDGVTGGTLFGDVSFGNVVLGSSSFDIDGTLIASDYFFAQKNSTLQITGTVVTNTFHSDGYAIVNGKVIESGSGANLDISNGIVSGVLENQNASAGISLCTSVFSGTAENLSKGCVINIYTNTLSQPLTLSGTLKNEGAISYTDIYSNSIGATLSGSVMNYGYQDQISISGNDIRISGIVENQGNDSDIGISSDGVSISGTLLNKGDNSQIFLQNVESKNYFQISGLISNTGADGTILLGGRGTLSGTLESEGITILVGTTVDLKGGLISGSHIYNQIATYLAGYGTIIGNINNVGGIYDTLGNLTIVGSVSNSAAINENIFVTGENTLTIDGQVNSNVDVVFQEPNTPILLGADLALSQLNIFDGTISSFAQGDTIDLSTQTANESVFDSTTGILSLYDADYGSGNPPSLVGTLAFSGENLPSSFALLPDGNGGTDVIVGEAPPSVETLAELSNAAYDGYDEYNSGSTIYTLVGQPVIDPSSGFLIEAFQDGNQIVITVRGTQAYEDTETAAANLYADSSWIHGVPNATLTQDVLDAAQFLLKIRTAYPDAQITITGHSLGGAIAQLLGQASGYRTVSFDAPGAGQFENDLSADLKPATMSSDGIYRDSINYRLVGDQVSLNGVQIGEQISYNSPYPDNWANALNAHSISALITQISTASPILGVPDAPLQLSQLATLVAEGLSENLFEVSLVVSVAKAVYAIATGVTSVISSLDVSDENRMNSWTTADTGSSSTPTSLSSITLVGSPGAPDISSIYLPSAPGVVNFEVSFLDQGVWSGPEIVSPGSTISSPDDKVSGISFTADDGLGSPVTLPAGFIFGIEFESTGTFSGTLSEGGSQLSLSGALTLSPTMPTATINGPINTYGLVGIYGNDPESVGAAIFGPPGTSFTITNASVVESESSNTSAAGIVLGSAGTVDNIGTILAPNGIEDFDVGGGGGAYVVNNKLIQATLGAGIYIQGNGAALNTGSISAAGYGLFLSGGDYGYNSGSIAALSGIVVSGGIGNYVYNSGQISATTNGIVLLSSGSTNNAGTIKAGVNGLLLDDGGTAYNYGVIKADNGIIISGGMGVYVYSAGSLAVAEDGIDMLSTGSVSNVGTIEAGRFGMMLGANGGAYNYGFISAAIGIDIAAGGTVFDYGSIIGTRYAISFASGFKNELILDSSSRITGTVFGGGGKLDLISGGAKIGTITLGKNQFEDFSAIEISSKAEWDFFDTITTSPTLNIINDGTIKESKSDQIDIQGSISGTGRIDLSKKVLLLGGGVSAGQKIAFSGTGETLALGDTGGFKGKLENFSIDDTIDLIGISRSDIIGDQFSKGVLTLSEASGLIKITFSSPSSFGKDTFALTADGSGTAITLGKPSKMALLVPSASEGSSTSVLDLESGSSIWFQLSGSSITETVDHISSSLAEDGFYNDFTTFRPFGTTVITLHI